MIKTLVILAAGLGSRYKCGIKQLEPVDEQGHLIIDYSIHDAVKAGFNKIVFIIRHSIEKEFTDRIGKRIEDTLKPLGIEIEYVFQETNYLPDISKAIREKISNRIKPWGTGHAVLCAADKINEAFAVINADDFYGADAFKRAADFLNENSYGLIGYKLSDTLSDNGGVNRGICNVYNNALVSITETKNIIKTPDGAEVSNKKIDIDSIVSTNFWCYPQSFIYELRKQFILFIENLKDYTTEEFLLPVIAEQMLKTGTQFKVISTTGKWMGMTYIEDKESITTSIDNLREQGEYKHDLYSDL